MARSHPERNPGWPHIFRVFAVLCAIMLLLARSGEAAAGAGTASWQVFHTYEVFTRWSVPALFMLWGMFALDDSRGGSLSGMALGYLLPTFAVLVLWSAVYALIARLAGGGGLSLSGFLDELLAAATGETHFHLWLLYPLLGLYLVLPVLQRFVSSAGRWEVLYFLILCFVFAGILPVWSALHPSAVLPRLLTRMNVHLVLGYTGYFVGGWYLRNYTISRVSEFVLYFLGIGGFLLTFFGDRLLGGGEELWLSDTAPGVALSATALCVLFRYVLGISDERSRRREARTLGSYAFGIYIIHQIWVFLFRWFGFTVTSFLPVLSVPLVALLVFVLSIPFAWLLSRIPGAGRYLV